MQYFPIVLALMLAWQIGNQAPVPDPPVSTGTRYHPPQQGQLYGASGLG